MCCCPCSNEDSIDEDNLILCCACCCSNISVLPTCGALGCSGKVGLACLSCDFCCKPGAPCLCCGCCGPSCDYHGCSLCNVQAQLLCLAVTGAFPCSDEAPAAITVAGLTLYPSVGCCKTIRAVKAETMVR